MPPRAPLNWGILPPSFLLPSSTPSLPILAALKPLPKPQLTTTTTPRILSSRQTQQTRTIKSISTPRPNRFSHNPQHAPLESTSTAALARKEKTTPLRCGALALKRGMTAIYDAESGKRIPCTVLQLDRNEVLAHKTRDVHGYYAVQLGAGAKRPDNVTRPMLGHFSAAGVSPKRFVAEFKVRDQQGLGVNVGEMITADWFTVGQWVDVKGLSRGMGFAGGMKRHGFGGQPASHGQSLMHRGMGSAGGSQGSGSRVLPGKRMAGRMGHESVTVENLRVLKVDKENGIVVVNGCVPGPKNSLIKLRDALRKPAPEGPRTVSELLSSQGNSTAAIAAATTTTQEEAAV